MTPSLTIAVLLAVAVAVGGGRLLWRFLATPVEERSRAWRLVLRICLPILVAMLLHRTLFPPGLLVDGDTLVVRTANADAVRDPPRVVGVHAVTLPEAHTTRDAERIPDLATALRRYPGTQRIRVIGAGLTARDRDAARGRAVEFTPSPLPRGLIELHTPPSVRAGRGFTVTGRAHNLAGGGAELLDPSGAIVDSVALDAGGRFRLAGAARSAGRALWRLRLRDADKKVTETADVPVVTNAGAALRILVLAGAPTPDLKYLRRWASDAGFTMDTRISLGAGMTLGSAPTSLDPKILAKYDVLLLDQRAWDALGNSRRSELERALRDGLGVVVQLSGPASKADRQALRKLGFEIVAGNPGDVRPTLPTHVLAGPADPADKDAEVTLPPLALAPLRLAGDASVPLLRDAKGTALAAWQAQGRGRIVVSLLGGSYRWVLAGRPLAHAELWNTLLSAAARASGETTLRVADDARAGQRTVICGIGKTAAVAEPGGRRTALHVDPSTGPERCAAFWPRTSGWHEVRDGARTTPLFVRAKDGTPALRLAELRDATRQLAAESAAVVGSASFTHATVPGPRWPWFLGWLALSAALWWFERSRLGTQPRVTAVRQA